MTNEEKIITIARKYGYDMQSRQCIEEMAELTKAINKMWRKHDRFITDKENDHLLVFFCEETKNIIEEMADVQIMLLQMKELLKCEDMMETEITKKLNRQIERMKNGE